MSPAIQAASFSDDESASLSTGGFAGHPVASLVNGAISAGDIQTVPDLVSASLPLGDLAVWQTGTPFLTQLHDDLGALLEATLTALGDAPTISPAINSQIDHAPGDPEPDGRAGRHRHHGRAAGGRRGDCVAGRRRSGEPGGAARPAIDPEPNRGARRRRPARGRGRAAQALVDPLEAAAVLLRRLLPVLRSWLQSLLGTLGAGVVAAVEPRRAA